MRGLLNKKATLNGLLLAPDVRDCRYTNLWPLESTVNYLQLKKKEDENLKKRRKFSFIRLSEFKTSIFDKSSLKALIRDDGLFENLFIRKRSSKLSDADDLSEPLIGSISVSFNRRFWCNVS